MPEGVGNYSCSRGQDYRFAKGAAGRLDFWPRSGAYAYWRQPLDVARCIRRGTAFPQRSAALAAATP